MTVWLVVVVLLVVGDEEEMVVWRVLPQPWLAMPSLGIVVSRPLLPQHW